MKQHVYRLIPGTIYEIGKQESWLAAMAKKGLMVQKYGRLFARFQRGAASNKVYRIDVSVAPPLQEQLEVYRSCGWELALQKGPFVFYDAEEGAPVQELHTDSEEQARCLERLIPKLKKEIWIGLGFLVGVLCLFLLRSLLMNDSWGDFVITEVLYGFWIYDALAMLAVLILSDSSIHGLIAVRRLQNRLRKGVCPSTAEPYAGALARTYMRIMAMVGFCLFLIAFAFVQPVRGAELPEEEIGLPVFRLEEIHSYAGRDQYEGEVNNNEVARTMTPLVPLYYSALENGYIKAKDSESSAVEHITINTEYLYVTFSSMTDAIIEALARQEAEGEAGSSVPYTEATIMQKPHPFFDRFIFVDKKERGSTLLASKGHEIFIFSYADAQSRPEVFAEAEEAFQALAGKTSFETWWRIERALFHGG